MNITIDDNFILTTTQKLVQIDSRNPLLVPDAPGEGEIGAYVAEVMRQMGLEAHLQELGDGRVNAIGILRGSGGGRTLMWNAHMDTVGIEGMHEPFSGEVRAGRVYGRGSQDMKGSLAAMLAAAKALVEAKANLVGDVILAAVADEEFQSMGTKHLLKEYHADGAIVTEPTDLGLSLAHKGFVWYQVKTIGRAAHGSRPQEGVDAILHMGRFLARLDSLSQDLLRRPAHPLLGSPSLHASLIQGGSAWSVYPAHCELKIERRTLPNEDYTNVAGEIRSLLEVCKAEDPRFQAQFEEMYAGAAFEIDPQARLVQVVQQAMQAQLGTPAQIVGCTFWTDAALLAQAGIETVLLGPVGQGLHSNEEWVDLASLSQLAAILVRCAQIYCQ